MIVHNTQSTDFGAHGTPYGRSNLVYVDTELRKTYRNDEYSVTMYIFSSSKCHEAQVMIRRSLFFPVLILLYACASGPEYDTRQVNLAISPRSAVAELEMIRGQSVLWGGVILNTINKESLTRLEVLAYPLNSSQSPQQDREPLGRFLLEHQGFLDPATYAEGRLVTTVGTVFSSDRGEVGGMEYTYPVIKASDIYLWPRDSEYTNRSRVHFGIGVGVGL